MDSQTTHNKFWLDFVQKQNKEAFYSFKCEDWVFVKGRMKSYNQKDQISAFTMCIILNYLIVFIVIVLCKFLG